MGCGNLGTRRAARMSGGVQDLVRGNPNPLTLGFVSRFYGVYTQRAGFLDAETKSKFRSWLETKRSHGCGEGARKLGETVGPSVASEMKNSVSTHRAIRYFNKRRDRLVRHGETWADMVRHGQT